MTFQQPAFMVAHPNTQLGVADINGSGATGVTDDSRRAWLDYRQGTQGYFTASGAAASILWDFAGIATTVRQNRCVIPSGHSFDGKKLRLFADDSGPTFPSPVQHYDGPDGIGGPQVGSGVIDMDFLVINPSFVMDPAELAWIFVVVDSIAAEVHNMAEIWLGERKALTANDARIDTGWERSYVHDLQEDTFGGRTASVELSPPRRKFSLQVRGLDPAGTDFATLDEVMLDGRSKPFWYWTPDSTDTGPYLVKLTNAVTRKQASSVPTKSTHYEITLEMIEESA